MPAANPIISIVIPTHNRAGALLQALQALEAQTFPMQEFEVVVVADGCTDDTVEQLQKYEAPFRLKIVAQESSGAAAARNRGAAEASGRLLLFLDDDITAVPQLVEAHVAAHQAVANRVVIGYLPPVLTTQKGFFRTQLKVWWEDMFSPMFQKGHRFHYRNLLSGNFSLPARLFHSVGGFNTTFLCQEDYELGVRLIAAEARFGFAPEALGYHNEITDVERSFRRKYAEGIAAVQFCRAYPQLAATLPLFDQYRKGEVSYYSKILHQVYSRPSWTAFKAKVSYRALGLAEWLRLRGVWKKILYRLLAYWYIRGIAATLPNKAELEQLLETAARQQEPPLAPLHIDLKEGLEAAEQKLDAVRPFSISLYYGKQFIGEVKEKSGSERLRGVHLRPLVAQEFSAPLMAALALEKALGQASEPKLRKSEQQNKERACAG